MRTGLAALAVCAVVTGTITGSSPSASAAPGPAPLIGPNGRSLSLGAAAASSTATVVRNSYIVVLKEGGTAGAKSAAARASELGAHVTHTFTGLLPGYSATLSSSELDTVRLDPAVGYVQQNLRYVADGTTDKSPQSWGLDRIDQRSLPLSKSYYYAATGNHVTAYVVDTGIFAEHPDFGGRVAAGVSFIGSGDGRTDCNGHGTHVAGTLGGEQYGVARRVTLVPVRVLDCAGGGDTADIVAGLDWVRTNHTTSAVVNLSLATTLSVDPALNTAVGQLTDAGVTVVAAAGNGNAAGRGVDACSVSPASAPSAITVGASTTADRAASFSNYGSCVDLYAPGVGIVSDWNKTKNGQYQVAVLDGTSQASPHAAGVAALYLEKHPSASPAEVSAAIESVATKDKVTGVPAGDPHDLLFSLQPVTQPAGVASGDRLLSGQSLLRTGRLYSANGAYFLAHRSSDNWLSLYQVATGRVVWTTGHSGAWTNMNTSGALSSYDAYGRRSWSTGTEAGPSTMIVNGKGYVELRRDSDKKVFWTSPH